VSRTNYLFTSESVSEGHPDKVCDRISDAVVDLYLAADPLSRCAVETLVTTNRIVMAGEVRGPETVTPELIEAAARRAVKEIGYEQKGFHWQHAEFENYLHEQSADIALGVDADAAKQKEEGAGDQGIMFGFACRETEPLMPAPIFYAHRILHEMAKARHTGRTPELGPDAKSQVTLAYENGKPVRADAIVVSTQHGEDVSQERVKQIVRGFVEEVMPKGWVNGHTKFYVNPTGRFVIGGPDGDCGVTGRKIIVDTYGGAAPHGGGAFSGKDRLCRPLSRQEHRRCRTRRQMHAAIVVCDRRVAAAVALCGSARHRQHLRGRAGESATAGHGSESARHQGAPQTVPPDL
jgi:S-adenosylmethionine synthetase